MDADADGKVSWEEFSAAYPRMREAAFASIDSSGDGSLSLQEWLEFSAGHAADVARNQQETPEPGRGERHPRDLFKLAPRNEK
jgi:hypothetical protein